MPAGFTTIDIPKPGGGTNPVVVWDDGAGNYSPAHRTEDGADATIGVTTDIAADTATVEDTTSRTGIGLWKGMKNFLKLILAKLPGLGTAGTANANVITVQGITSMTPLASSIAYGGVASGAVSSGAFASGSIASGAVASGAFVDGAMVTTGTKADAPATTFDTTSWSVVALLKGIGGFLSTLAGTVTAAVLQSNTKQINGVTVLMGAGNSGTGAQRIAIATDDINLAAINAVSGTTSGAAVVTDANGTVQQYLRGLAYRMVQLALGNGTNGTALRVTLASDSTGVVDAAGTKVSAATIPAGGVGLLGWLSAIWYQLTQSLIVSPNNVTLTDGTAHVWNSAGGTSASPWLLTCTSLASAAARQGAKADLGATRAEEYMVGIDIKMAAGGTDGSTIDVYWAGSPNATAGTDNPGHASGVDGSFTTPAEYNRQLQFIGSLVVSNTASTNAQSQKVGPFRPKYRYGSVVLFNNATGQALSGTATDCYVTLTPCQRAN